MGAGRDAPGVGGAERRAAAQGARGRMAGWRRRREARRGWDVSGAGMPLRSGHAPVARRRSASRGAGPRGRTSAWPRGERRPVGRGARGCAPARSRRHGGGGGGHGGRVGARRAHGEYTRGAAPAGCRPAGSPPGRHGGGRGPSAMPARDVPARDRALRHGSKAPRGGPRHRSRDRTPAPSRGPEGVSAEPRRGSPAPSPPCRCPPSPHHVDACRPLPSRRPAAFFTRGGRTLSW